LAERAICLPWRVRWSAPSGARMPQDRNGGGSAPDVMDASPGRTRDHRIAQEQAALRRVAVLVAGGPPPE